MIIYVPLALRGAGCRFGAMQVCGSEHIHTLARLAPQEALCRVAGDCPQAEAVAGSSGWVTGIRVSCTWMGVSSAASMAV